MRNPSILIRLSANKEERSDRTAELSKPVRIQGAFISEEEVGRIVEYLRGDEEPIYIDSIVGKQGGTVRSDGGIKQTGPYPRRLYFRRRGRENRRISARR